MGSIVWNKKSMVLIYVVWLFVFILADFELSANDDVHKFRHWIFDISGQLFLFVLLFCTGFVPVGVVGFDSRR